MSSENTNENGKKANRFVVRGKAACKEIGVAFMGLSLDAKIIVGLSIAVLVGAIFCTAVTNCPAHTDDVSAGSLISDAKQSLKESYQEGLNDVKNDPEIKKNMEDIKKNCKELGEASGQLKNAMQGLGF